MKRTLLMVLGFWIARWIFHRKPMAVDPVTRLRRAGAL
jgi:hypothetical protein